MAGQIFVAILTSIFVLVSKRTWRQKLHAIAPIAVGLGLVFSIYNIPDYQNNANLIETVCIALTLLSAFVSILILRRSAVARV
jgi:predicted exporter